MISAAMIGFGNSVVNYHLPYLERQSHVKVKTIYRREEDRIGDTEREGYYPAIGFTTNLQEIWEDNEIELVVICTHVDSHYDYAKLALEHNKHVLVEKPFASSPEEAQEIFNLAKDKNLIAMANQNRRYDGDFLTLKKVIESGKLGNIIEIQSHYDYFRPQAIQKGFGLLHGLAVHTIDQLISLYGKADQVHYDVRSIYYPGENEQGPTLVSFEPEAEDNWGVLSYVDEEGTEHTERVPSEVTDYGILYEELYQAIKYNKEKPIKDEEVLYVLGVLNLGVATAKSTK